MSNPSLNFSLHSGIARLTKDGKPSSSEDYLKYIIESSVFQEFISKFEIEILQMRSFHHCFDQDPESLQ